MAQDASSLGRQDNVYLYVPNLIGYARVFLAFLSYAIALKEQYAAFAVLAYLGRQGSACLEPRLELAACCSLCCNSFVCDELDGRFARMLNQTSTLGAVLDMVTDRVGTTGLLAILCVLYPKYHIVYLLLLALDIFSHWFQMYATLLKGNATHKDSKSKSWIVRMYYKHRLFMGFCCVCCEVLYVSLYMIHWPQFQMEGWVLKTPRTPPLPLVVQQWLPGGEMISKALASGRHPIPVALALAAIPGTLIKQVCNWAQLTTAVEILVQHDLAKKAP